MLTLKRYYKIVENLKPDVLVHPTNHSIPEGLLKLYDEIGTDIIEVQREGNQSATNIISKIINSGC